MAEFKELNLEIITPSKSLFSGEIKSITVPGAKGRFQILKNHAPLVSTLDVGVVKVDFGNSDKHYAASGGTIEVLNNKVLLLADSIESVEDIDLERAKSAKERAENRLSDKGNKEIDVERAQIALARAMNRIKVKELFTE